MLSIVYPFELDPRGITEFKIGGFDNKCDTEAAVRLGAEESQSEREEKDLLSGNYATYTFKSDSEREVEDKEGDPPPLILSFVAPGTCTLVPHHDLVMRDNLSGMPVKPQTNLTVLKPGIS